MNVDLFVAQVDADSFFRGLALGVLLTLLLISATILVALHTN